jgi:hypothetical protein
MGVEQLPDTRLRGLRRHGRGYLLHYFLSPQRWGSAS